MLWAAIRSGCTRNLSNPLRQVF